MSVAAASYTRRQRLALPGSSHDRIVSVLKVLLPFLALALLALIIILPLSGAREFSFLLAKDKVAMAADRLRLDKAVYRGETAKGQPFIIRAGGAVQHSSAVPIVELTSLDATLAMTKGDAHVTAPTGKYDMDHDRLNIAGPVRVDGDAGYTLDSKDVVVSLIDRTVQTDSAVTGTLPLGNFRANALRADLAGETVVLTGRAHLHILGASARRAAR
ncbi:LPS export ABC transporter periplasmic protein LptC [Glacieibacterium sp.]|uniref:LPS export ABC transporter periplasmic protein LptC n=1 Tax=Glacieibacterium sp. TaxID=2860237 RepID=UPI003B005DA8